MATARTVRDYVEYEEFESVVARKTSKSRAKQLLTAYRDDLGGETTHFSVVDADGMIVAVTQSIDSYFGARVAHPRLGFLYNNYMQGFQVDNPDGPYALEARQMPKSSMSAAIVMREWETRLVLGSPGSSRIISAATQVTSRWVDLGQGIEAAVNAFRVHVVPDDMAYVEGSELPARLLAGLAVQDFACFVQPTGFPTASGTPISAAFMR